MTLEKTRDSDPRATHEFNVVLPGRERCDNWTSFDEALDQVVAFLELGCPVVTIEQRDRE